MAEIKHKFPENKEGKFYVDDQCISCDACVSAAPNNFKVDENVGHAYVIKQPVTPEEEEACKDALASCPTEAIGNNGDNKS